MLAGSALTATAADGTRVEMQILDHGQPVVGAQIAIFLSCDKLEGTTGDDGRVVLESVLQRRLLLGRDRRPARRHAVSRSSADARTIDLADVSFMTWQGGR